MTETFELDSAEAKEAAKQLHLGWFTSGGFCYTLPVSMVNPPPTFVYIYIHCVCIGIYVCIYIVAYIISGSIRSKAKIASSGWVGLGSNVWGSFVGGKLLCVGMFVDVDWCWRKVGDGWVPVEGWQQDQNLWLLVGPCMGDCVLQFGSMLWFHVLIERIVNLSVVAPLEKKTFKRLSMYIICFIAKEQFSTFWSETFPKFTVLELVSISPGWMGSLVLRKDAPPRKLKTAELVDVWVWPKKEEKWGEPSGVGQANSAWCTKWEMTLPSERIFGYTLITTLFGQMWLRPTLVCKTIGLSQWNVLQWRSETKMDYPPWN